MKLTILTPTYNRSKNLGKLFESLNNQTNINFKWMIIDDGSEDNTEEIVNSMKKKSKFEIEYFYQQNGGKHRALNFGISKIETIMTFIVDSDDYLTNDAVDIILNYYNKYKHDKSLCGFSFLRGYSENDVNGKKFPLDEYKSNYIECRLNQKVWGDKSEVYYTKCLKEFPFIEIKGENFLFEDYVWIQLAEKYSMIHINKIIYIGEYLQDGLTKNINKRKKSSPIGMSKRGIVLCTKKANIKTRIKGMIHYISYGLYGKIAKAELFKECNYKLLYLISFFPAIIYYYKIRRSDN